MDALVKIVKIKQGQTSAPIKLFNIVYPKRKVDLNKIINRVQEEYQTEVDPLTKEAANIL